ncbi:diacylglycerol/lipid kinase family protein [Halalkalicoccus salilacus]|uniref:diacylglycerol/lipid kinase family protein n=1 Tax=Halalkalicoccus salilacus TaxID=3117459 RepID=UPI00300F5306
MDSRDEKTKCRLVLNPVSGGGDHAERARRLAESSGLSVVETEHAGHGVELAKQAAADGVDLLAVCGGDGTIHEVIQGLVAAEALETVTLCVVPAGTVNILADGLGIRGMRHGFKLAESGETRRLDLGIANDEPFVISAVVGVPAEASASVSPGVKNRLGRLGFVIEGIQKARSSGGLRVEVEAISDGEEITWQGDALSVFAGNLRRFMEANERANAEDGTLEITIVEPLSGIDAIVETVARRLLHRETPHVTDLQSDRLEISALDDTQVRFSLDGEIRSGETVRISVRPRALSIRVGDEYVPRLD